MDRSLKNSTILYDRTKTAKVGEEIACATCGRKLSKKHCQQAFCGERGKLNSKGKKTLCKDQYWNRVRFHNGDLSTARRQYVKTELSGIILTSHPFSSDAPGQD